MDNHEAQQKFRGQQVARLATVSGDGVPHLVPIVFALPNDVIYTAVDGKPKTTSKLKRLSNIAANSRVSLIVDVYDEDWSKLWWVRADGVARILDVTDTEGATAIAALVDKYRQYDDPALRPRGPIIAIDVRSWHGWSAT